MDLVHSKARRGVTSVLAMMYLVLFSSLAIGFYAATTTSVQIVGNEERNVQALLAAESGFDFFRHHLASLDIQPPDVAPPLVRWNEVVDQLAQRLENTSNVSTIGVHGDTMRVPEQGWVTLPNGGGQFYATLRFLGQTLHLKVVGRYAGVSTDRAIDVDFDVVPKDSIIFNFGVASRGTIYTGGSSVIKGLTDPKKGSILSTSTATNPVRIDGKLVSGDISITSTSGNVIFGSNTSIGGTTDPTEIRSKHIHTGVTSPDFPKVTAVPFIPYVTNPDGTPRYYGGESTPTNVVIKAGTNPTFSGATINGVLYVEAPNVVTFSGTTTINGVIIGEQDAPDANGDGIPDANLMGNILDFKGTIDAKGVETLDPAVYGDLTKLTGSFILAPEFRTNFSGNFGTIGGSIISGQLSMTGNAGGTVVGSIIQTTPAPSTVNGSGSITIASTGTTNYPAGVHFGTIYLPLGDTYKEGKP